MGVSHQVKVRILIKIKFESVNIYKSSPGHILNLEKYKCGRGPTMFCYQC